MSHLLINTTIHCYCRCPAVTTSSCCSTSTTTKLSHLHYITTCSRYITRSPPIISQNSPLLLQLSSHRPLQSSVKTPQCCFNCPVTVPSNHQSKPGISPMLLQLSSHVPSNHQSKPGISPLLLQLSSHIPQSLVEFSQSPIIPPCTSKSFIQTPKKIDCFTCILDTT